MEELLEFKKSRHSKFFSLLLVVLSVFLFGLPAPASAFEFGFLTAQDARSENLTVATSLYKVPAHEFYYAAKFAGWFSVRTGANSSFFAQLSYNYKNESITDTSGVWKNAVELDRFEFSMRANDNFFWNLGRVPYADILGTVADGVYDGGNVIFSFGNHTLSGGAFYTGLLYKETAVILMSKKDQEDYIDSDYFAPKHYLFSFAYDYTSPKFNIALNVLRQADIHPDILMQSLYLLEKMSFRVNESIDINLNLTAGAIIQLDGFQFSVAPEASVFYNMNYLFPGRLGFEARYWTGDLRKDFEMPVLTKKRVGYIYDAEKTNLVSLKLQYLASLSPVFSFETGLNVFLRTTTDFIPNYWFYSEFENRDSKKYLLGEEFSFMLICAPFSDFSFNIGTGLFFPDAAKGTVYLPISPVKWDIRVGVLISL